jgi:serine/threonine-protein kinase GIN4
MLRRMIAPNADVRCTATEAMEDPYWSSKEITRAAHRKSASLSQAAFSAMNIDMDTSKFLDIVSPFTTRTLKDKKEEKFHNKENMVSPSSRNVSVKTPKQGSVSAAASRAKHTRSQSQPKVPLSPGECN